MDFSIIKFIIFRGVVMPLPGYTMWIKRIRKDILLRQNTTQQCADTLVGTQPYPILRYIQNMYSYKYIKSIVHYCLKLTA